MKNFVLKGWLAVGVSVAAAVDLILAVMALTGSGGAPLIVSPQGVTNFDTLQVGDGSVSEPAFGFTSDTDAGFYRVGANDIGVSAGGSKVGDFTSAGWTGSVSVGSNDITGRNVTATGSLYQDGIAFTGPLVGSTGTISDNIRLAHSVGTTPTEVICGIVNAGVLTETVYVSATNATSITLGVFDAAGVAWSGNLTVHCMATR